MNSEDKYKALAKERHAAALRWRARTEAETTLQCASDRLFRWRGTRSKWDRKYAARALGWAVQAIRAHCA